MKKVIYLDAGHSIYDPGTVTDFGKEFDFNLAISNALKPELERQGFKVFFSPTKSKLDGDIRWVNNLVKSLNDGLALSVHCNCCRGEGAETYYYGSYVSSKKIAKTLIDEYSKHTGIKNRGAKSDTITRFGQLGWIRKTKCWSTLIEVGFLDNEKDTNKLKDYQNIAKGICKGVCKIFGIEYKEIESFTPDMTNSEKLKKAKELAQKIINL